MIFIHKSATSDVQSCKFGIDRIQSKKKGRIIDINTDIYSFYLEKKSV